MLPTLVSIITVSGFRSTRFSSLSHAVRLPAGVFLSDLRDSPVSLSRCAPSAGLPCTFSRLSSLSRCAPLAGFPCTFSRLSSLSRCAPSAGFFHSHLRDSSVSQTLCAFGRQFPSFSSGSFPRSTTAKLPRIHLPPEELARRKALKAESEAAAEAEAIATGRPLPVPYWKHQGLKEQPKLSGRFVHPGEPFLGRNSITNKEDNVAIARHVSRITSQLTDDTLPLSSRVFNEREATQDDVLHLPNVSLKVSQPALLVEEDVLDIGLSESELPNPSSDPPVEPAATPSSDDGPSTSAGPTNSSNSTSSRISSVVVALSASTDTRSNRPSSSASSRSNRASRESNRSSSRARPSHRSTRRRSPHSNRRRSRSPRSSRRQRSRSRSPRLPEPLREKLREEVTKAIKRK